MGRQSHLARLALGRSPFGPPLEDENGNFILGPNVQHDTGRDYVQDFDSRGHPRSVASETLRSRLLRAQNEALFTIGVVVREAKAKRSRWQTMSDEQKHRLVNEDNMTGAYLGIIEGILQKLSTHWILNFRRRILTYKSYLGLPVTQMILSEWNIAGPRVFLFAGFFPATISRISQYFRVTILEQEPFSRRPGRSSSLFNRSEIARRLRYASLQVLWFALEYPFHAYSVLQALYLFPLGARPSLLTLLPFTASSAIHNPARLRDWSLSSLASYVVDTVHNPFVLALLRDQVSSILFPKLYIWVRQFVAKPDRPDRISLQSASDKFNIVPEKPQSGGAGQLVSGQETVRGIMQRLFSTLLWFSASILHPQRMPLAVEHSPEIGEELIRRSNLHYQELVRQNRELDLRRAPRTLRVMAIRSAFHDLSLDPDHSVVDIFELADEMSFPGSSRASTSTPEPQELPLPDEIMTDAGNANQPEVEIELQIHVRTVPLEQIEVARPTAVDTWRAFTDAGSESVNRANHEEWLDISDSQQDTSDANAPVPSLGSPVVEEESFQPAVPLETLLESAPPDIRESPLLQPATPTRIASGPGSPATRLTSPPSPVPGISRAASLPHTTPRPLRRPTISDQHVPTFRDEVNRRRQEPDSRSLQDTDVEVYRVTMLSNHVAEALEYHATSIIESVVLLPLDVLFFRSLTRTFLAHHSGAHQMANATHLLYDVWPLSMSTQMRDLTIPQELQFWGNFLVTIGMQGLTNFAIWATGTQITLKLGERFGWGKI